MYEYISALGDPPKDQIPVTVSAQQSTGQPPLADSTQARDEAQGMITHLQGLIERVRSGEEDALAELQRSMSHHDVIETFQAFERYPDSHPSLSSSAADRQLWARLRESFALAQQVAEGNDPQRRRNAMIAAGVGAGALVFAAVAYLILKR